MIIYRFAHKKFATDLSGTGAKLNGGRWNFTGIPVVYSSEHISLGLLEVLVNANTLSDLQSIQLLEIEIPVHCKPDEIKIEKLKKDWYKDFDYSRYLGSELLKHNNSLLIKCPSAVINREYNYLLNPLHPDIKQVKLKIIHDFDFDERLFKNNE